MMATITAVYNGVYFNDIYYFKINYNLLNLHCLLCLHVNFSSKTKI